MVDYVKVNNGAWNLASSWDIGVGWPSSSLDTATMGVFDTEIPAGVTITCGAITMTGTGSGTRSRLNLNGTLNITADMTLNAWNEFNMSGGAELELNGNDVLLTSSVTNHNRLVFVGSALSRARVSSSVAGSGRIWRLSNKVHCHVDMQYCDFVDIGGLGGTNGAQGLGENFNFTAGEYVQVEYCTFTGCDVSSIGGFLHVNATLILRYCDLRDPFGTSYSFYFSDTLTATAGSGVIECNNMTFSSSTTTLGLRVESGRLSAIDVSAFSNTPFYFITSNGNSPDFTNSFAHVGSGVTWMTTISIGAAGSSIDSYVLHERDNPKPYNGVFSSITRPVVELVWTDAYTDDGDLFILRPSFPTTLEFGLVLDERSCAAFNALGATPMADVYNGHNNTLVGNYDAVYGSIFRTESGGSVTGTLNVTNNITYNKTPVAGSLGFNFDAPSPAADQVTFMDSNCWYQIDDPYHGVTSATKTPGVTVGYGGNDITDNPNFLDATRSAAQYDLLQGTGVGTVAAVVNDMLNMNGYDSITKSQIPANASPRRPIDVHSWVRAGFAPTNVALQNAGEGGVTIGAMEYTPGGDGFNRLINNTVSSLISNLTTRLIQ